MIERFVDVLHVARGNGVTGPVEIAAPASETAAWTVTQTVTQTDNV